MKMADLERRLREKPGETPKFKHMVAQMTDRKISI